MKQTIVWIAALALGAVLGALGLSALNDVMDTVATVYTRLFQLLAVPTIVLAVVTTLAQVGADSGTGRIFRHTLVYTLLTTTAATAVGLLLYIVVAPAALPIGQEQMAQVCDPSPAGESLRVGEWDSGMEGWGLHLLNVVPNNIVRPFLEGNVLSLLLLAFAVGLGLSKLPESENKAVLMKGVHGLQELLFLLIRGLIRTLPLGIVAFAAQLTAQLTSAGFAAESLGKYVLVVLGGNVAQIFVVLPLFLLARGINPLKTLTAMSPAVLMALFTKSSAATLPVTMQTAEKRLGVEPRVARFVLPICTTINMNGCAAFILITSLFVMQQGGTVLTWPTMLTWLAISVIAAIGNAGVPMGCYFLTFSLMSG
ncbi:MAG: dicarboxylate/amino acid:cation symporter, partial [Prevotella sp.]|nr:dicarboxylate/amino acid:cation symporter [Prevotella sp.]